MRWRNLLISGLFLTAVHGFAAELVLRGGTIYVSPFAPAITDATVVLRDGKIAAVGGSDAIKVPAGARVLDCSGKFIVAGFWNSHVHILTPQLLNADRRSAQELSGEMQRMFAKWGFTTVFDIASVLENTENIRKRIEAGEIVGPRILTVGAPFYPDHGTPIYVKHFLEENHIASAEVQSAAQAAARARQQLNEGADGVKIFSGAIVAGGKVLPMSLDIAKAVVNEAHKRGKPAFAHPSNLEGLEVAINSGVDILAHTAPMSGDWRAEFTEKLKSHHMALIPTLTLFEVEDKKFGASPEEDEETMALARQELGAYLKAGGQILFGTDAGYIEQYDTTEEFRQMAEAGMSWRQILASLTTSPAERFHAPRQGSITKGKDADVVVLDADPAQDVTAFSNVDYTIRAGKIIYSKSAPEATANDLR